MKTKNSICPVFIGGVGRSGTTILSNILAQHDSIYTFPQELRFITDPDGLISLKGSLVDNWSSFHATKAIDRFIILMNNLKSKYIGKYPNHSLSSFVGKDFYKLWLKKYYSQLIEYSEPNAWAGQVNVFNKTIIKYLGNNSMTRYCLPNLFYCKPHTRENFQKLTREFMMEYFTEVCKKKSANFVVEHTPYNLIHFDFINHLLPEAKLIHIYRDPRDVICSYKTKDWGSKDIIKNATRINDVLSYWEELKPNLLIDNYLEISFEKLMSDYENELKKICDFLKIPFSDSFLEIDVTKHNIGRWRTDLKENEKKIIDNQFYKLIEKYGSNN